MRTLACWVAVAALAAQGGERRSLTAATILSPDGGVVVDTPRRIVEAPPLLTPAGPLAMAEIPAVRRPAGFLLIDPAGHVFGPYPFEDGAVIGAATAPYTLARQADGSAFSLVDPRTRATHGPFAATNGAPVMVGAAMLAFARQPGTLRIRMSHRGALGAAPRVAAGALTPATLQALAGLRASLVEVANRLAIETAPVTYEGMPTIIRPTGTRQAPVARKSLRDREAARQAADRTATAMLEAFQRACLTLPLGREPDGGYVLQPAPEGPCLVCALWLVRDPDAVTAAGSRTAVWWTPVAPGPEDDARLTFDEARAGAWRDVFRLPPLRD